MTQHAETYVETTVRGSAARYRQESEQQEAIDGLFSSMFDRFVDAASKPENHTPQPIFGTVYDPDTYEPKWAQVGVESEPAIDIILRDLRLYVRGSFDADNIAIDPSIIGSEPMSRDQYIDAYIGHNVDLAIARRAVRLDAAAAAPIEAQEAQPAHISVVESDPDFETNKSFGAVVKELTGRALSVVKLEFHSAKIDITDAHKVQLEEKEPVNVQ